jgi:hypothetical protein
MSIWSSLQGFDLQITEDRNQYSGDDGERPIALDVATSSMSSVIRLGAWDVGTETWAAGVPRLDVTLFLRRDEAQRLIDGLQRALELLED